jgi:uncharacterized protein
MDFNSALAVTLLAAATGGFLRGFAGFGGALIFVPVVSAAFGPKFAAPIFLLMDYALTLPMVVRSIRICRWSTVAPAAVAGLVTAPVGARLLATGDPTTLRWVICGLVVVLLALVISGWRYLGEPKPAASVGVGAVSGLFGGIGQVSGPPVIAFWISGPYPAATIRANTFCFFGVVSLSSFIAYFWNGLFTLDVLKLILVHAPLYAGALFLGSRVFRHTKGANYRPVVYALIALAALTSMPVFDGILR